jgi:uncharacterized protein
MKLLCSFLFCLTASCIAIGQSSNEQPEIPPGVTYKKASATVNAAAKALLEEALSGDKSALKQLLGEAPVCGPMLWQNLKPNAQAGLLNSKPVSVVVARPTAIVTEGRTLITDEARELFWGELMSRYPRLVSGTVRKAKSNEISYYWATIPFDIEEPFFAIEAGTDVFIAHMRQSKGKMTLFWIDLVGALSALKPEPPSDETLKSITNTLATDAETQTPQAMLKAGRAYLTGDGVPADVERARKLIDGAAQKGVLDAQMLLGMAYFAGKYFPQDRIKAAPYLQMAAAQGNAMAQYYVGMMYLRGGGLERSAEKALPYLRQAADQNYAAAEYDLGAMYFQGIGAAVDKPRACALYARASDQGHLAAINDLGWCYQNGEGVEKDLSKAKALYSKAAEAGHLRAQGNLAMLYRESGEFEKAYVWLRIAEVGGGGAQARPVMEDVKRHMTREQIEAAEIQVTEWETAHSSKH